MSQVRPNTRFRAPFSLRCGAALVDYSIPVGTVALATLVSRSLDGSSHILGATILNLSYLLATCLGVANFVILVGLRGKTLGKWTTGLRIEPREGKRLGWPRVLVRQVLGYGLTILSLGLGLLPMIIDRQGRALHDFLAGTVVTRERGAGRYGGKPGKRVDS